MINDFDNADQSPSIPHLEVTNNDNLQNEQIHALEVTRNSFDSINQPIYDIIESTDIDSDLKFNIILEPREITPNENQNFNVRNISENLNLNLHPDLGGNDNMHDAG